MTAEELEEFIYARTRCFVPQIVIECLLELINKGKA